MFSSASSSWGTRRGWSSYYLWLVIATAIIHLLLVMFCRSCLVSSNLLQTMALVLALVLSVYSFNTITDVALSRAWSHLVVAFSISTLAESYCLWVAVHSGTRTGFPSAADFLWLLFPLPLLLLATTSIAKDSLGRCNWLDILQAALFFVLLAVLVFSKHRVISVSSAYDLQSVALLLVCFIRYRNSPPGPSRTLLRNVSIYLVFYGCSSSIGDRLHESGLDIRAWADLCWSYPPLLFCALVLFTQNDPLDRSAPSVTPLRHATGFLPIHLQAASALTLALMSGLAAAYVGLADRLMGILGIVAALAIFAVRTGIREAQLYVAHDDLNHAAHHDALTGLANRATLLQHLRRLEELQGRSDRRVALLFLDLDRFKAINDGLGHEFGDRLLVKVSEILQQETRDEDLVVRLEGDEFIVLLQSTTAVKAGALAERIVQRFHGPLYLEGRTIHITVSVGIVLGSEGQSADELIRDADCAMYEAKKRGRNRAEVFCASMQQDATEALDVEMALRNAIRDKELLVYYQPIVSAVQSSIVGFEALSRWHHAKWGFVSPSRFIPVAEETGLILELGRQALEVATSQVHAWNRVTGRTLYASVNVSARQFANPAFLDEVLSILNHTGLSPTLLKLEITESVLLNGYTSVIETLQQARAYGITISMDDFGTGYSSLSYLQNLPFDTIKIDQSFVKELGQDLAHVEFVRTLVQLVRQLGKEVVVEGVETKEQLEQLHTMPCDLLQGYLFSGPLPADSIAPLLDDEEVFKGMGDLPEALNPLVSGTKSRHPAESATHYSAMNV